MTDEATDPEISEKAQTIIDGLNQQIAFMQAQLDQAQINLEVGNDAYVREINAHRETAMKLKIAERQPIVTAPQTAMVPGSPIGIGPADKPKPRARKAT